nr:immunoglobulin light chain junction region [Macaca mulatta]
DYYCQVYDNSANVLF